MTDLHARLRLPDKAGTDLEVEDIFASGLDQLFPDVLRVLFGDPGSSIAYLSPQHGAIVLDLAEPIIRDEEFLYAHHLWNASLMLAYLVEDAEDEACGTLDEDARFLIKGHTVLELGAGTGLAGLICALASAKQVTISDYPSEPVMKSLRTNVARVSPIHDCSAISVEPHAWGDVSGTFADANCGRYTRILCGDCLWIDGEHDALLRSICHFLTPDPGSEVWVVAGFHTGWAKVAAFFDLALSFGLLTETIWEQDTYGNRREWAPIRTASSDERRRWLAVAILRRKPNS